MPARFASTVFGALLLGAGAIAHAVTVVKCRDSDGSEYFAERCPGGAVKVDEQKLRVGGRRGAAAELAAAVKTNPVLLFTVPDCDACDLVRQQLQRRGVPFTEKEVATNAENQVELRDLTGGGSTVPTVAVGKRTFTGYSRAALDLGLDEAGYPARPATAGGEVAATR